MSPETEADLKWLAATYPEQWPCASVKVLIDESNAEGPAFTGWCDRRNTLIAEWFKETKK